MVRVLALTVAVAVVVTGGQVFAGAANRRASTPVTWGAAHAIPELASLSKGLSIVNAISCPTAGNCTIGGDYASSPDPEYPDTQGFVADESSGHWAAAHPLPGLEPRTGGVHPGSTVTTVSCAAPGDCAAGGDYENADGLFSFVVAESNGVWGAIHDVTGLAALQVASSSLYSVSCGAVGDCAAVGGYRTVGGVVGGYIVDLSGGQWGTVLDVPAPGSGGSATTLSTVSCTARGACTAGGAYVARGGVEQGLVVEESDGTWGAPRSVPGPRQSGPAELGHVSCSAPGNCAGAGGFQGPGGANDREGFVVEEVDGVWGASRAVPGLAHLNAGDDGSITSISCGASGSCAAGGYFLYAPGGDRFGAFVLSESNGTWGAARSISGIDAAAPSSITSVSCGAAGSCVAIGGCECVRNESNTFVVSESNGAWGKVDGITGTDDTTGDGYISCASADHCAAVAGVGEEGVVAEEPGMPLHCSPAAGLMVTATRHATSRGVVDYRIVYTNRGAAGCELTGVPGAMGFATTGREAVGPPATRTPTAGRGGAIYLGSLGGQAETTLVVRAGPALRSRACRPKAIDEVIVRPEGVPQTFVRLGASQLVCQGFRSEAIYGFGPIGQSDT